MADPMISVADLMSSVALACARKGSDSLDDVGSGLSASGLNWKSGAKATLSFVLA